MRFHAMLAPMSGVEKRRFPRVACMLPVRLYPTGERKLIETLTKDLSTGGLKCLSPVPKPVATALSLELALGQGELPVNLRAKVAWFQSVPRSDQFYMGLCFLDISDEEHKRLSRYIEKVPAA